MKAIAEIERRIRQHVEERWAEEVAAELTGAETWWPRRYSLGRPDASFIEDKYDDLIALIDEWRHWASLHAATVVETNVRVNGNTYPVLSHILIPHVDAAAEIAGTDWRVKLQHARKNAALIDARFPHRREVLGRSVAGVSEWTPVDVELLTRAASWFEKNPNSRLSARQVPLEGFHSKWLESRRHAVARLAGLDDLGLLPPHPSRIHFTYLDPGHLAARGRRHDSATVGDSFSPAYIPDLVIISENKDTAVHFPEVDNAIAVEGAGSGAAAFAGFNWLRGACVVVYWGDMDADGLRILAQFRTAGIPAQSLFMDLPTFRRWEKYGTNTDKRGNPIVADGSPAPRNLEDHELALYEFLTDAHGPKYRRVEQERIPLGDARAAIVQMREVSSSTVTAHVSR